MSNPVLNEKAFKQAADPNCFPEQLSALNLSAWSAKKLYALAADPKVVTTREFPGLYHEIFNEPERDNVFAVLRRWLDEHASA